jgi:hypothetical protein
LNSGQEATDVLKHAGLELKVFTKNNEFDRMATPQIRVGKAAGQSAQDRAARHCREENAADSMARGNG